MNRELLEKIYSQYAEELRLYLYSLCRDTAVAEDLMQDVFVKALMSLRDDHNNFRAWLYRVAHNICINYMKRNGREQLDSSGDHITESIRRNKENDDREYKDDPLQKLLRREKQRNLFRAMDRLPGLQREVLVLMYFTGMRTAEVSEVLAINPQNVRVAAHRGRKELAKILEKEGYHEL
ncbi:MAG: RNA polymerase sigma factor [Bacillota bacterium]|nr:RNA polymerase sigma factor [Bacillota bacterium]